MPPRKAECDTRSTFKRTTVALNSDFSFSLAFLGLKAQSSPPFIHKR